MQKSHVTPLLKDIPFWKFAVLINGLVPLVLLAVDGARGQLGGNSVNYAIHSTGIMSLLFLVFSLSVTPVRLLTGWNGLIAYRRTLGLFAFFYACVHVSIYVGLDRALSLASTMDEILKRRYLQVGLTAIVLMIPLAVTSTNSMIQRMGAKRWKLLHRSAYLVAGLGSLHYFMLVKSDVRQPLIFAAVLTGLLSARFIRHYLDLRKAAQRPAIANPPVNRQLWKGELQVARVFDETPDVRTFRLVSPDEDVLPFRHQPGQFLNLQLEIDGKRVNRSYTIASSPTQIAYCELTIKREDSGKASLFLHDHVHVGDRLHITAPAGKFVFTGKEANSVVLIAGGVGITPLMSIARYLTDRGWQGEIHFLIVAKTSRDIIFYDELTILQKRFVNFHVYITLTRVADRDSWTGSQGRISAEWLNDCAPTLTDQLFYLCGPDNMMATTRNLLIEIGVDASRIRTEAFVSPGARAHQSKQAPVPSNAEPSKAISRNRINGVASNRHASFDIGKPAIATFERLGKSISVLPKTTLLEASEQAGINLPFECRAGVCGQCKVKLLSGSVTMDSEDALSSEEKATGLVLACQSRCHEDISIDA